MYCSSHCRLTPRSSRNIGRFPSPGGRADNSPAVHCRVLIRLWIRPEGTVEIIEWHPSLQWTKSREQDLWEQSSRPFGTRIRASTLLKSPSGRELPEWIARKVSLRRSATAMECAGIAQRRRRFGLSTPAGSASQSGVALRLPPHSKAAGFRLMGVDESSVLFQLRRVGP